MIEIKDISGKVKFSTPINVGAKGRFMLMKEDYITIPFSTDIPVDLKRGDYVDLRGVFDDALGGSSIGRVPAFQAGCCEFEPRLPLIKRLLVLGAFYFCVI